LIYAPLGALYLVLVAESLRYSIKYHAQSVGYLGFSLSLVAACLILFIYSQEWRHEELVERFLESERQDASREQAAKRRP
jgi:hypothetical protein